MFNTTTILRMMIIAIQTRVETMSLNYWSKGRREGITNITFRGNNRKKGLLSKKTNDIFCPVGAVTIESQERF